MNLDSPKVVLFTANVYGSFVKSEIEWLIKENQQYSIVTSISNPEADAYPGTIKTADSYSLQARIGHVLKRFFPLASIFLYDTFSKGTSSAYLFRGRRHFSLLLKCSMIADALFQDHSMRNARCYTFFANDYALALAMAAERGYISSYSTRVHGRDVIEEREPKTRKLPFQWFKYEYTDLVYCVSVATKQYITRKYPRFATKIKVEYLGSQDHGMGPTEPVDLPYHIVSVGRVRNVKRFYLIAEMLQHIDLPVKWSHFGDIQENDPTSKRYKEAISALDSKPNIEVLQRGYVENAKLLQTYKSHHVDLLINSSEIEGLPVSIQEAISFGIPCLATDVGGTADIVNEQTGILVDATFDPLVVSQSVTRTLVEKCRDKAYRQGVRAFWEEHFDASKNYPAFFERMTRSPN
ncbi:glycosyltransferase [Salibacteraceae bacterium]|nr:glycosyltransferase [Salibacteraceae bacterium]